jgi:hypothetical protein
VARTVLLALVPLEWRTPLAARVRCGHDERVVASSMLEEHARRIGTGSMRHGVQSNADAHDLRSRAPGVGDERRLRSWLNERISNSRIR